MKILKNICNWVYKNIIFPVFKFINSILDAVIEVYMPLILILVFLIGAILGIILYDAYSIDGTPKNKELKAIYKNTKINIKEHNFNSEYSSQRYFIIEVPETNYYHSLKDIEKYKIFFKNKGYQEISPIIKTVDSNYTKYNIIEYRFINGDK